MWGVGADEPHCDALAAGDLVLIYLGAPHREFIGRAELSSAVRDWTLSEARVYPGDSPSGVSLAEVKEWDPPVPMNAVLSQIDRQRMLGPTSKRASFGSPPTNLRLPSPWRPDARSRRSRGGRLARVTFPRAGPGDALSCQSPRPIATGPPRRSLTCDTRACG